MRSQRGAHRASGGGDLRCHSSYVALLLYGQIVAAGVVEEKANKIIEILLSTVRARQLLFGKVIGIVSFA